MEALGGAGGEVDFGEVAAVGVEDVYCAELVEVAAGEAAEAVGTTKKEEQLGQADPSRRRSDPSGPRLPVPPAPA